MASDWGRQLQLNMRRDTGSVRQLSGAAQIRGHKLFGT